MDRSNTTLKDLYTKLSITKEEEEGIVVGIEENHENKVRYVLLGKFLTEKIINFNAMQNSLLHYGYQRKGWKFTIWEETDFHLFFTM